MGTSAILDIYDAIAEMEVSFTAAHGQTITPAVYNLQALPKAIEANMPPCRLLLPFFEAGSNITGTFTGIGKNMSGVAVVLDVFYYRAVKEGIGLHSGVAYDLVAYDKAYREALQDLGLPTTESYLQSATFERGVYFYPAESGREFLGVACTLSIEEFYCS
jgi:hypothetical protein